MWDSNMAYLTQDVDQWISLVVVVMIYHVRYNAGDFLT
jgi:hypothetical protein